MGYPSTGILAHGDDSVRSISARFGGVFATRTALKAVPAGKRVTGMICVVATDNSRWIYSLTAAQTTDTAEEFLLIPAAGDGRWLRFDKTFVANLEFTFATADAAVLLTMPEGYSAKLVALPWWEVDTAFTGGSSSAIGISSAKTGYSTKGDFLGGASGNVLADLTAGVKPGTIGPKLDTFAEHQALVLVEADTIRFDRITSVFTAGAGRVKLPLIITSAPATP